MDILSPIRENILSPIRKLVSRFVRSPDTTSSPEITMHPSSPSGLLRKGKRAPPPLERIDTTQVKSMAGVLGMTDENPDDVLKKRGIAVYDEMEAKDAHVYAVYQTRKLSISLLPWEIIPGGSTKRDMELAEFVFTAIEDCKGTFSEDIKQLLDAIGKGFSILEIIYKLVEDGRWRGKYMLEELFFHKQRYWFFKDKRWHKSNESVVLFGPSGWRGTPVSWEKIIHFAFDSQDNLYGRAAFKPCFHPDSLIFTNPGLKSISEIQLGDKVLNSSGKWVEVEQKWITPHDGKLIEIKANGSLPFKATENHPLLAVQVKECSNHFKYCKPRKHETCRYEKCGQLWENYKPEWIEAGSLKKGDFLLFNSDIQGCGELPEFHLSYKKHYRKDELVKEKLNYSPELMRFFGYYLAEGYVDDSNNTIKICLSLQDLEEKQDVSNLIKNLFHRKATQLKSSGHISFSSKILGEDLRTHFGYLARSKKIPLSFLSLPDSYLAEILKGLFRGDGCRNRYSVKLKSTSSSVAMLVSLMLRKLGFSSAIHQDFTTNSYVVQVNKNAKELGNLIGSRFHGAKIFEKFNHHQRNIRFSNLDAQEIKSIKNVNYSGLVYNLGVKGSDHSYCLPFVSARNCYWFYWFKKEGWKSWIIFLNKYGSPTAFGKFPKGTTPAEQQKLLDMIEAIQEESGMVYEEGNEIGFLEPSYTTTASYQALSDACNAEISKGILGATQIVEEGRRGSYALSRAHSEVRRERIEADTVDICDIFQDQLVKRLIDFNYITDVYPQFVMRKIEGEVSPPAGRGRIGKPPEGPKLLEAPVVEPTEKPIPEGFVPGELSPEKQSPEKQSPTKQSPTKQSPEDQLKDKIETPSEEPIEKSETVPSDLKDAFDKVRSLLLKGFDKKQRPVVNVSAVKQTLANQFGESKAYRLAGSVKSFIETRVRPENVDEVIREAQDQLEQEVGK